MSQVPTYDPQAVEARWQVRWAADHVNEPQLDRPHRPFYNLMMFPYPSAEGLHVGNMFAFTGADIYGRFRRLQGHDVFEPIGFDAFGMQSGTYALQVGTHPARLIPKNIETFRRQLRRFGGMFDWRHELSTTDPGYYKWTQWIFVQLFKAGLAFRKKAAVNWCPKDMSVVANEQVINGFCERHPDTKVEQRFLEQWFFAITRYAERLLTNLDRLDWSESTRTLQRNWIGRSEGAELVFETPGGQKISVFTTRPDTVFGATYLVLAPEHPLVEALTADEQRRAVNAYRRQVQYRLHDWCISRQRYWGPPIPVIYCDRCGPVAVPERDLPVELPLIEDFRPDASGVSPLARHKEWYFVKCPQCGAQGRRETDVSDTFLDSAWYFLRYPSTEFEDRPWDTQRTKTWLPVSTYIGGNEHAVLHLLYSRFVTMALRELGHVHFEEPFPKLRAHGLIIKDGAKMSKSRGNVVIPDAYIQKWGADTFRMYLMFLGPFQEGGDFRATGIIGVRRFLDKVWQLAHEAALAPGVSPGLPAEVERKLHQTIRKVTVDTDTLNYNTAIAAMMEYVNEVRSAECGVRSAMEPLLVMLAPYAPHLAEDLWAALGHERSIFTAAWPAYDERLAAAGDVEIVVQVNGKVRGRLVVSRGASEDQVVALAMKDAAVRKFVDGHPGRKAVYVQDRLLNLVV